MRARVRSMGVMFLLLALGGCCCPPRTRVCCPPARGAAPAGPAPVVLREQAAPTPQVVLVGPETLKVAVAPGAPAPVTHALTMEQAPVLMQAPLTLAAKVLPLHPTSTQPCENCGLPETTEEQFQAAKGVPPGAQDMSRMDFLAEIIKFASQELALPNAADCQLDMPMLRALMAHLRFFTNRAQTVGVPPNGLVNAPDGAPPLAVADPANPAQTLLEFAALPKVEGEDLPNCVVIAQAWYAAKLARQATDAARRRALWQGCIDRLGHGH